MAVILDAPLRRFQCPSCRSTYTVRDARIITPMHPCRELRGVLAPYVELLPGQSELPRASHVHRVIEREDYEKDEKGVLHDAEGKAVMAVQTERSTGYDTHVFPATAYIRTNEVEASTR